MPWRLASTAQETISSLGIFLQGPGEANFKLRPTQLNSKVAVPVQARIHAQCQCLHIHACRTTEKGRLTLKRLIC